LRTKVKMRGASGRGRSFDCRSDHYTYICNLLDGSNLKIFLKVIDVNKITRTIPEMEGYRINLCPVSAAIHCEVVSQSKCSLV
jgi:hypothetical protein